MNERDFSRSWLIAQGWVETADGWKHPSLANAQERGRANIRPQLAGQEPQHNKAATLGSKPQRRKNSKGKGIRHFKCRVTFWHYRSRLFDVDNYDTKDLMDAIRDTGVVPDDGAKFVEEVRNRHFKVKKGQEKVTVFIEII